MTQNMNTTDTHPASLLLVDDDRHLLDSMGSWLGSLGYDVALASNVHEAREQIQTNRFDLALVDLRLGEEDGFDVLETMKQQQPGAAVILITGYGTVETGVEALRAGAFDLLTKPLIDDELHMAIQRALSQREVLQENRTLKAQLDQKFGMDNIVGSDPRMRRVFEMIDSVADTRATVLITGQSGTGKSLIARAIHRRSDRRDGPFVEIACGALPENLLESELFGHVAGAFTGAAQDKDGKFKLADGGTIFLDEIGTASPGLQVKLLRVLQEFQFEQVGGSKTFEVNTRVILATNEDLSSAVEAGRFRQDLFYRINVINLELPSLSERRSDIPNLANHFLQVVCNDTGKSCQGFEASALDALQAYNWPGNVRELQNVIERAVLLGKSDRIQLADLPGNLSNGQSPSISSAVVEENQQDGPRTLKQALEGPERQIILQSLQRNNWNRNETADELGINRTTLYKKMKKLGLEDPQNANIPWLAELRAQQSGFINQA